MGLYGKPEESRRAYPLLIEGDLCCAEDSKVLFNLKPILVSVEDKNFLVK